MIIFVCPLPFSIFCDCESAGILHLLDMSGDELEQCLVLFISEAQKVSLGDLRALAAAAR